MLNTVDRIQLTNRNADEALICLQGSGVAGVAVDSTPSPTAPNCAIKCWLWYISQNDKKNKPEKEDGP